MDIVGWDTVIQDKSCPKSIVGRIFSRAKLDLGNLRNPGELVDALQESTDASIATVTTNRDRDLGMGRALILRRQSRVVDLNPDLASNATEVVNKFVFKSLAGNPVVDPRDRLLHGRELMAKLSMFILNRPRPSQQHVELLEPRRMFFALPNQRLIDEQTEGRYDHQHDHDPAHMEQSAKGSLVHFVETCHNRPTSRSKITFDSKRVNKLSARAVDLGRVDLHLVERARGA